MKLNINDMTVKIKGKVIVDSVSAELKEGTYGLLGPNGAGKTTMLRGMLGIYNVPKKSVLIDGDVLNLSKTTVGYLPQEFGLFPDFTAEKMMRYMCYEKKISKNAMSENINECLSKVGLLEVKDKKVREMSGGMVRRLGIAQALLGNPSLIVLDEPTAGLDPEERLRMKRLIYELKGEHIIIYSTHIVDDLEGICDMLLIMDNGGIKYNGDCVSLTDKLKGHVYEVKKSDYETIIKDEKAYIINEYEKEGCKFYRIVCEDKIDACSVTPKLEDGYIWVQKNFS